MSRLQRVLTPKTIAVVGGGAWCESIIGAAGRIGFSGDITPVHPSGKKIAGQPSVQSLSQLKTAPDATFIGVNRHATIEIVRELNALNAGGAVCFASGFSEAQAELEDGDDLQAALLDAAGDMPILGPNCYGFINALDGAAIWPDQHGCSPVETGVAILTQSSNIAINLTMQKRGLPIGFMVTCGNQAQLGQAEIASDILDDPRVTAIGLHIEGFQNLPEWEAFAQKAYRLGKPVVALKVGASEQAQAATISHTASLAGSHAGASALIRRLGMMQVSSLTVFLETLKFLHINGPQPRGHIGSISCSGGEASLAADLGQAAGLIFPDLSTHQKENLGAALGPKVALANPLDYHTYIWRDANAMTAAWTAMDDPKLDATMTIVDYPRDDICDDADWACATTAAINTRQATGKPTIVVASLPELLPEHIASELVRSGVTPMHGLHDAIEALAVCSKWLEIDTTSLHLPRHSVSATVLSEADAKAQLSDYGVNVPKLVECNSVADVAKAAQQIAFPAVLKGTGAAHKSELGLVALNLGGPSDVAEAAQAMQCATFLLEEMVQGAIVELIIGVVKDMAHGYVLTVGAGGILTEVMKDTQTLLLPARPDDIRDRLQRLKIAPVLNGYRGKDAVDIDAIIDTILAVQRYVIANGADVEEVEINPLMCTATRAVAADALIRKA